MPDRKLISLSEGEKAYAMSRAVVQGDWCFVSGSVGYDAEGNLPESAAEQAKNTFVTIKRALAEAGFSLKDTIRVQYTVTDKAYIKDVLPIIQAELGDVLPAATMVIAGLVKPEMKIEIEVTAFNG